MADISKIKPNGASGTEYNIKDATARAAMIPSGGTQGQVLVKKTGTDYDTEWATGGGTTVVANPSGTATDDLTKVQIGSTIYNIPSGTTIVQIPSVVGDAFTYNGTAQGPTVTGLDTTHCTVTGATQTNAGTYTLTIALNDPSNMVWSDLTTANKTYSYTIAKANQTLTLSTYSVTLDSSYLTKGVIVSGADTSLSATTSDDTVATASVDRDTVWISSVNNKTGSATISITAAEDANHNASAAVAVSVTASFTITQTITVYSAASDTVSFTDAAGAKTVTTNSSGSGTVSVAIPLSGSMSITFTSSVAKNPDNLSAYYSKTVNINTSTSEVYIMPDRVGYWFGYWSSDLEICNAANGWSGTQIVFDNPTLSTNYITFTAGGYDGSNYHWSAIGFKTPVTASHSNVIYQGVSGSNYGMIGSNTSKAVQNGTQLTSNQLAKETFNLSSNVYAFTGASNNRTNKTYAFWLD